MISRHLHPDGWHRENHSRALEDLLPTVRQRCVHFLEECARRRIDILIVSTFRDHEAQQLAYKQGLSHWPAGWSWHNWRCAFDVLPLRHGKPLGEVRAEDLEVWETVGDCGRFAGLEWGGSWTIKRERPHFQYTYGRSIQDVNHGIGLGETIDGHIAAIDEGMTRWQRFWERFVPAAMSSYIDGARRE